MLASTIPNCVGYDPTYAYEVAVIIQNGLKRMYVEQRGRLFLHHDAERELPHPAMPEGAEEGILKGMYKLKTVEGDGGSALKMRLLGAGAILREVEAGAELLAKDFGVTSEIWSVTSFTELRREGLDAERWNMLHPEVRRGNCLLCRAVSRQGPGAGDRGDGLHEGDRRRHSALCAGAL